MNDRRCVRQRVFEFVMVGDDEFEAEFSQCALKRGRRRDTAAPQRLEFRGKGVFLRAAPIDVSAIIRDLLLDRMQGTVLTSATLAVGGNFDFVAQRLGVRNPRTELVESHFDHYRQALLYVPQHLPDPRNAAFTAAAVRRLTGSLLLAILAVLVEVAVFPRTYSYPKVLAYAFVWRHLAAFLEHLHAEDVRAVVQLARIEAMSLAVPGEERHPLAAQRGEHIGPRRLAKRRRQGLLFAIGELGHVVQAAATNDSDLHRHQITLSTKRLPSFSRRYPAAMVASCSKNSR